MGYERHDYAIVHFSDYADKKKEFLGYINKLKAELKKEELDENIIKVFVGINGRHTAMYFPDGSKKGWKPSEQHEKYREQFIEMAKTVEYAEIVQIAGCLDHCGIHVEFETESTKHEATIGDY